MSSSTHGLTRWTRPLGVVGGLAALAVGAAVLAPQAFGGDAPVVPDTGTATAEVTQERGVALAGTGDLDGRRVFVEVYANSVAGSQATVLVEQRGGPEVVGHVDLAAEDVLDGTVEIDTALSRATRGGLVPTRQRAQVHGSWAPSGPGTAVNEVYEDAGYLIATTGTNTPLTADVVVTVEGEHVELDLHDAFAFDLTVTRTPL